MPCSAQSSWIHCCYKVLSRLFIPNCPGAALAVCHQEKRPGTVLGYRPLRYSVELTSGEGIPRGSYEVQTTGAVSYEDSVRELLLEGGRIGVVECDSGCES